MAGTGSPSLRSDQVKALPAAKRQRLIQLPLLCFDLERDRTGQELGYLGYCLDRLTAVEALEEAGDVIQFQHFAAESGEVSRLVVIDEVKFIQSDSPTNSEGYGGLLQVTLRTVD